MPPPPSAPPAAPPAASPSPDGAARVRAGSPAAAPGLAPRGAEAAAPRGRGAASNPAGRFERLAYEADPDALDDALRAAEADGEAAPPAPRTLYLRDPSRTIVATNQSPDVGFDASVNPYRGCEHGCAYCYARPTHEYLGFSAGLDFETRILVKEEAPALLRRELERKAWRPRVVAMSGVTDAYQPIERRLRLTRRCLEVLAEFRNPVGIVTKSALVARDADVLGALARVGAARVDVSITTLDAALARSLEPRASHPARRLGAIEALARAGVPVGVMVAPVIPGLNDAEIPRILRAAKDAGASSAGSIVLRLPHGVKELFAEWLERCVPERRARVLARIRDVRGGALSDPRFGTRMRGEGLYAEQIRALFELHRRRAGLDAPPPALSAAHFRRPADRQLSLGLGPGGGR
ncbi:MAG: PA0069 family radical SAM protein [Myxococcota bacterium]